MNHNYESSNSNNGAHLKRTEFRPALDSGLSVGDQLLQVDGQSLISVTHLNAIRFLKGPFTLKTIKRFMFSRSFNAALILKGRMSIL